MMLRGRLFYYAVLAAALSIVVGRPSVAETITYSYDPLGRLTAVSHNGGINTGLQQTYSYDNADNRTNGTVTGSPFNTTVRYLPVAIGGAVLITAR